MGTCSPPDISGDSSSPPFQFTMISIGCFPKIFPSIAPHNGWLLNWLHDWLMIEDDQNHDSHLFSDLCCIPHTYIALSILNTNSYTTILCLFCPTPPCILLSGLNIEEWGYGGWVQCGYNKDTLSHHKWSNQSPCHLHSIRVQHLYNRVSLLTPRQNHCDGRRGVKKW